MSSDNKPFYARLFSLWASVAELIVNGKRDAREVMYLLQCIVSYPAPLRHLGIDFVVDFKPIEKYYLAGDRAILVYNRGDELALVLVKAQAAIVCGKIFTDPTIIKQAICDSFGNSSQLRAHVDEVLIIGVILPDTAK